MEKKLTKPRILVVGQHYWPENFRITDITDFFADKGAEIDVLCGIPNYPKGVFYPGYGYFKNRKQARGDRIKIRRVFEIPRGNNSNIRIFINYMSFPFASFFHLPRLLFKQYDKIFMYSLSPVYMSAVGIILGRLKNIETTMYVLDLWPENLFSVLPIKNSLFNKILTRSSHWHYKKADKLVVLSNTMKKHMVNKLHIDDSKIIVLPQTCEKIYETDIQDDKLINKYRGKFIILYAGNISPAQSFSTIINAAEILSNQGIKDIHWLIVGDGMSSSEVKRQVKTKKLDGIFTFEGMKPVEDIPRYSPLADALVGCLVKSELLEATIPAKVMSYIASGRPIVLSMDGEVKDLIENKIKCGFVGATEDAEQLAQNIQNLYKLSMNDRDAMGKRARKYHFEHFERNKSLQTLYNFIFAK